MAKIKKHINNCPNCKKKSIEWTSKILSDGIEVYIKKCSFCHYQVQDIFELIENPIKNGNIN